MRTLSQSYWPATTELELHDSTCADALAQMAKMTPRARALIAAQPDPRQQRVWTYAELQSAAEELARALVGRYSRGARIAVWGANQPEWVVAQFAIAMADMAMVTVNPSYSAREFDYVMRQSRAQAVVYQRQYRSNDLETTLRRFTETGLIESSDCIAFDDIATYSSATNDADLPQPDPYSPAMIQYTSGTTGAPKGAVLTHHNVTNNSRMMALIKNQNAATVNLAIPPLFHTGGCVAGVLATVQTGGTILLPEYFDAAFMLDLVERENVTYMFGVPTMLIAMLDEQSRRPRECASLETIFTGGTVVPVDVVKRVECTFEARLIIGYGMTESSPAITHTRPTDSTADKSETIGYPIPQIEVKIADPASGEIVPVDVRGELCTRGFHVMAGYFDLPEATAEAIDDDGWLHTGDLCTMDARGYCRIVGRLKDMIIRGGENISPREIEEEFYEHPSISEIAVFGIGDDYLGEIVVAAIVAKDEAEIDLHDLTAFGSERLAKYKVPARWYVMPDLPMTLSGKVRKVDLRERCERNELEDFRIA